tara:strand:- start:136 stop:1047 length:912 start_codon:yes stop_codon:yes gene_type:complete
MTTVTLFNPYPDETRSMLHLPKKSPLHHLRYSLLTEKVIPEIKRAIRKRRKNDIKMYINNTHNNLLDIAFNDIFRDARRLKTYKRKDWIIGKKTKNERISLMLKNDISIQYIKEAFERQVAGPYNFKKGDFIVKPILTPKFLPNSEQIFGIITKVKKSIVEYVEVETYYDKDEKVHYDQNMNDNRIKPKWTKIKICIQNNTLCYTSNKLSIWSIRYLGHISQEIAKKIIKRQTVLKKRNNLARWSRILKQWKMPYDYYRDDSFDIFKGELPEDLKNKMKFNIFLDYRWNTILSEAKRYETEKT